MRDALWNFSKAFALDPDSPRPMACAIELGQDDPVALGCGGLCAWLRRRQTGDRCRFRQSHPSAQPSFCTQLTLQRLAQCFSAILELLFQTSRK
jgi:hypothetical protein